MVSLNIAKRIKEFAVRKVLGASQFDIISLINRSFLWIVTIACILGCLSGYYVMDWLLDIIYAYRMPLSFGPLAVSVIMIFALAGLTVGAKISSAAGVNPADQLRNE